MAGALLAPSAASAALTTPASSTLFTLQSAAITESSGVALAGGVYWTHNDGPNRQVYSVDGAGRTLATVTLPLGVKAPNSDLEDIAAGLDGLGRPSLYIGDIGDNGRTRAEIAVVRIARPPIDTTRTGVAIAASNVVKYRFKYPDGKHDAESLLVQPGTNRIFVISKAFGGAVYAAPLKPSMTALNTLTKVGSVVIPGATGAAFSGDGKRLVVRQYKNAALYSVSGGDVTAAIRTVPVQFNMPSQAQGESITFGANSTSLVMTSEGVNAPVLTQSTPS